MKQKAILIIVFVMLTVTFSKVIGQVETKDIPFGKSFTIYSKILDEERPIYIYLPTDYNSHLKRYPVLYLLDGRLEKFRCYTGAIDYYSKINLPELIVVGIPNTDRIRDMTPYKWRHYPQSGGGVKFLKFITDELIPTIDSNFRTTNYRLISGRSQSAHFVFHLKI